MHGGVLPATTHQSMWTRSGHDEVQAAAVPKPGVSPVTVVVASADLGDVGTIEDAEDAEATAALRDGYQFMPTYVNLQGAATWTRPRP